MSAAPVPQFMNLSADLQSLSGGSKLVSALADEVKALFAASDLPALRNNVQLVREICVAVEASAVKSRVVFNEESARRETIMKVHAAIFGAGDTKDQNFTREIVNYLYAAHLVEPRSRFRRMLDGICSIFR